MTSTLPIFLILLTAAALLALAVVTINLDNRIDSLEYQLNSLEREFVIHYEFDNEQLIALTDVMQVVLKQQEEIKQYTELIDNLVLP